MLINGRCHCENISFTLVWEPDPLEIPARACACSFCAKHGAIWTSCASGSLKVSVKEPALVTRYAFGTKTAQFHVCARCCIVPVVTSLIEGRLYAGVNVNTFEGIDSSLLRRSLSNFEGESREARLARRKQSWIANVELAEDLAPGAGTDAPIPHEEIGKVIQDRMTIVQAWHEYPGLKQGDVAQCLGITQRAYSKS